MKDAINRQHKKVLAEEATKEDLHFCPECKTPVVLRSGENSTPYFAHPAYTGETLRDICPRFSKQSYKSSSISATYATGQKVARSNFISSALRDGKLTPEEVEDMFMLVHSSYAEKVVLLEKKEQEFESNYEETLNFISHDKFWNMWQDMWAYLSPELVVEMWLRCKNVDPSRITHRTDHERPVLLDETGCFNDAKEVYIHSSDPTLQAILTLARSNDWCNVQEWHDEEGTTDIAEYLKKYETIT